MLPCFCKIMYKNLAFILVKRYITKNKNVNFIRNSDQKGRHLVKKMKEELVSCQVAILATQPEKGIKS